jgi:hypothetical protein
MEEEEKTQPATKVVHITSLQRAFQLSMVRNNGSIHV